MRRKQEIKKQTSKPSLEKEFSYLCHGEINNQNININKSILNHSGLGVTLVYSVLLQTPPGREKILKYESRVQ